MLLFLLISLLATAGQASGSSHEIDKEGPYLYLSDTTILDMSSLQVLYCDQQFPARQGDGWSQGEIVRYYGASYLVLCGGWHISGCWAWTPSGWESMDTTYFNIRYSAAGSLLEGGWLVTGGRDYAYNLLSSVLYYTNDKWVEYPDMPGSVDAHCQVTVGSEVFVIGGYKRYDPLSTVYKLSGGTWSVLPSIKTAREGHMCSVLDNVIYVMGGSDGYNCLTSVEMLLPGSNDWVEGPPLPGAVGGGQSVVYRDAVFVMGGHSSNNPSVSNTNIYKLAGDQWMPVASFDFPPDRHVFPAPLISNISLLHCA